MVYGIPRISNQGSVKSMPKSVPVRVTRAKDVPLGGDMQGWINKVWEAVGRNFESFEARDKWDVYPVEVHLDHAIVQDMIRGRYYRANITVDKEKETVNFTKIQRVTHQWVPMDEEVSRGETEDTPPILQTILVNPPIGNGSLFGDLFG